MIVISPPSIPERWLHWSYREAIGLPPEIRGTRNERIRILQPGTLNFGNGPDFQSALLEIDGVRQIGDVEIHISPECWYQHGHDHDERYGQVCLHLLWDAPKGIPERLAQRFSHVLLSGQLTMPVETWRETMQRLESSASQPPDIADVTLHELAGFAEQRFRRKVQKMRDWLSHFSPEDVLFLSLGETLGYSANKNAFRQLLWQFPASRLGGMFCSPGHSPMDVWFFLVYAGGLGELLLRQSAFRQSGAFPLLFSQHIRNWQNRMIFPVLSATDWHFSRLRPFNSPFIRLAGFAAIWFNFRNTGLFEILLSIARERLPERLLRNRWQSAIDIRLQPAFIRNLQHMLGFRQLPERAAGNQRQRQFLLNAVLPLMHSWAEQGENFGFLQYIEHIFEQFPSTETPEMLNHFIGGLDRRHPFRKGVQRSGFYQQGLLEWSAGKKKA